jgi:hypothetical protein
MEPYLASLREAPNPDSTLRWTGTPTFALVREMLAGRIAISHAALDRIADADGPPGVRPVAFLRAGLVDAEVLERREDPARSFEDWLGPAIAVLPEGRDRALVEAYARWEIAPRHCRRLPRGLTATALTLMARDRSSSGSRVVGQSHPRDDGLASSRRKKHTIMLVRRTAPAIRSALGVSDPGLADWRALAPLSIEETLIASRRAIFVTYLRASLRASHGPK